MASTPSIMKRITLFLAFFLCAGLSYVLFPSHLSAQNYLERISATERSDGKGFVIRFHMEQIADSFRVVQPAPDQIQVQLFSQGIDTMGFAPPSHPVLLSDFRMHKLTTGAGFDIFLRAGNYFMASAYPDQNGKDLLLALEKTGSRNIEAIVAGVVPVRWENYQESLYISLMDEDDSFLRLREGNGGLNVIILDAGHGGHDPGTLNRGMRLYEKDIALAVTLKLGEYIEQNLPDVQVIYTRTDDRFIPLEERGLIATRARGDLFVSIHVNAAGATNANGTETFFLGLAMSKSALDVMQRENSVLRLENGDRPSELSEEELLIYELANAGNMATSERIATMIESQFKNRAQRRSRGVKQAGLMALWHASMPAVLVELGFLSNPEEARFLNSEYGQAIMASAIFRAIRDFKLEYDKSLRQNGRASTQ